MEEKKNKNINSPIRRKEFLQMCGSVIAGGTVLAAGAKLATKTKVKESDVFWQLTLRVAHNADDAKQIVYCPYRQLSVFTPIGCVATAICAVVITAPMLKNSIQRLKI